MMGSTLGICTPTTNQGLNKICCNGMCDWPIGRHQTNHKEQMWPHPNILQPSCDTCNFMWLFLHKCHQYHCGLLHCNLESFVSYRCEIIRLLIYYSNICSGIKLVLGLKLNPNSTHHVSIVLIVTLNVIIIKFSDHWKPFPNDSNPNINGSRCTQPCPTSLACHNYPH